MKIKDRIKDFRRVPASEILPNPKNWRTHPEAQRNAMRGVLAEVGIAGAVLARETADGLMLIDGHLRVEELEQDVPVLVLDVTEEEADKLLAVFDPIGNLAGKDDAKLEELIVSLDLQSDSLKQLLEDLIVPDMKVDIEPPSDFKEFDENIDTEHSCPKCGYSWSGGT